MKLSVSVFLELLLGICCLLSDIHVDAATTAKCNTDKCVFLFPYVFPFDATKVYNLEGFK